MQLAAMMLAPTFPETGAGTSGAPSPMTLSRYDTQNGLYFMADRGTVYSAAFWHPGIGAWQFDSAGGWNLTAADAISTDSAAKQAAEVLAQRWCSYSGDPANYSARRAYAWLPWYGCDGGRCESIFVSIYDPNGLRVNLDSGVSRGGGMQSRTCKVAGIGVVPCKYVSPSMAQGHSAFAKASFGRSPVSAPFYVIRLGNRELRWWIPQDTGYPITMSASKIVTDNARRLVPSPAITWSAGGGLCDVTAMRGACDWTGWMPYDGSWVTTPALVKNADRRLEMFAVRADGQVFNSWQDRPDGTWSPLVALSRLAIPVRELVAGRNPDGRLELFALLSTGSVAHSWQVRPGGSWSPWFDIGGVLGRDLSVGAAANGRLELFGLDPGGNPVRRTMQANGQWTSWRGLGGPAAGRLNVSRNADGRLEIYVVGVDGRLRSNWQRTRNGSFGDWLDWGGSYADRPTVVSNSDGRLEVFVRHPSGALLHAWQLAPNAAWSPMFVLAGSVSGSPIIAVNFDGRLEAFASMPDGRMAHSWQDRSPTGWSSWLAFDAVQPTGAVAINSANGNIVLAARGADGRVYRNTQLLK